MISGGCKIFLFTITSRPALCPSSLLSTGADISPTSLIVLLWIYAAHCSIPLVYRTRDKGVRAHLLLMRETGLILCWVRTAAWCGCYCPADVTSAGFPVAAWEFGEEPLCGRFPQIQWCWNSRGMKLTTHLLQYPRLQKVELYLNYFLCFQGVALN
jgi:hypothetical protein